MTDLKSSEIVCEIHSLRLARRFMECFQVSFSIVGEGQVVSLHLHLSEVSEPIRIECLWHGAFVDCSD